MIHAYNRSGILEEALFENVEDEDGDRLIRSQSQTALCQTAV